MISKGYSDFILENANKLYKILANEYNGLSKKELQSVLDIVKILVHESEDFN